MRGVSPPSRIQHPEPQRTQPQCSRQMSAPTKGRCRAARLRLWRIILLLGILCFSVNVANGRKKKNQEVVHNYLRPSVTIPLKSRLKQISADSLRQISDSRRQNNARRRQFHHSGSILACRCGRKRRFRVCFSPDSDCFAGPPLGHPMAGFGRTMQRVLPAARKSRRKATTPEVCVRVRFRSRNHHVPAARFW